MSALKTAPLQKKALTTDLVSLFLLSVVLGISSCAHAPSEKGVLRSKIQPRALLAQTCMPGSQIKQASGVALMKAKSPDASGQFSAAIDATAPASLKLEVQQPFGGTAAVLTIRGSDLRIDVPGKPERSRHERESWAGIPLKWAADLFLGKIPCPDPSLVSRSNLLITDDNELVVATPPDATGRQAEFVYRYRENKGQYWANSLHWESGTAAVDFEFDDPESETLSPLKWQAKSKQGEVKIRWRNRDIVR